MRAQGSAAVAGVRHVSGAHRGTAEVRGAPPTPTSGAAQGLATGALGMKTHSGDPGTDGAPAYPRAPGPRRVRGQFRPPVESAPRSPRWPQRGRPPAPAAPSSRGCRLWVRVRRPQGHIQAPDARTPAGKDPSGESARSPADLQTQTQDKSPRPSRAPGGGQPMRICHLGA